MTDTKSFIKSKKEKINETNEKPNQVEENVSKKKTEQLKAALNEDDWDSNDFPDINSGPKIKNITEIKKKTETNKSNIILYYFFF